MCSPQHSGTKGEWAILVIAAPGEIAAPAGLLLVDSASDKLYIRLVDRLDATDEAVRAMWQDLKDELYHQGEILGGRAVLEWLEDSASHIFRLASRSEILLGGDADEAADRLFTQEILPFHMAKNAASAPPWRK